MALMACRRPRKTASGERGQALLELVPVMLLLLTLTFAVIDFGRAIWQVQVITGLTREGSNLASRNTTLLDSATAVVNDGAALNLKGKDSNGNGLGKVIITSVQNVGGTFVITGQYQTGTLVANSKIGVYIPNSPVIQNANNIPVYATPIPPPGDTIYVTEIYSKYSGITPLTAFVNFTMPTNLYDVAYF